MCPTLHHFCHHQSLDKLLWTFIFDECIYNEDWCVKCMQTIISDYRAFKMISFLVQLTEVRHFIGMDNNCWHITNGLVHISKWMEKCHVIILHKWSRLSNFIVIVSAIPNEICNQMLQGKSNHIYIFLENFFPSPEVGRRSLSRANGSVFEPFPFGPAFCAFPL